MAKTDKFLRANLVRFDHFAPMDVDPAWSLVAGANSILPVIVIGETAARPPNYWWFESTQGFNDIGAETIHVGDGRILSDPDAIIDAATKVLGKMTVDIRIDSSKGICWV